MDFISHNKFKGLGVSLYLSQSTAICGTTDLTVSMDQVVSFLALSQNCERWLQASSCLSVWLSAWNDSAPPVQIFIHFLKICPEKIQVSLTTDNNGNFTWRPFWLYLFHFFLEWEMFRTKAVEKIKLHILCSATFFENLAVYEIMWKNIVEWGRPQMTMWRMHIACRISKATCTYSE